MQKHSEEYNRYMRSKAWDMKREERLKIDNYECVMCSRPQSKCKSGLQVHHITYRNLGNEGMNDLVSLCPSCHKKIHRYYKRERGGYNGTIADT